jgi:hypothetical protein
MSAKPSLLISPNAPPWQTFVDKSIVAFGITFSGFENKAARLRSQVNKMLANGKIKNP